MNRIDTAKNQTLIQAWLPLVTTTLGLPSVSLQANHAAHASLQNAVQGINYLRSLPAAVNERT